MDNSAHPSRYESRLVRLLAVHAPDGIETSGRHFADRFGNLMGLAGSISLSKVHTELSAAGGSPGMTAASADVLERVTEAFLRARRSLVRMIAMSFIPMADNPKNRLPTPEGLHAHFQLTGVYAAKGSGNPQTHVRAFEPYRQFYTACQRELEMKIQPLRVHIGAEISCLSSELAQLSKLDASLGDVLSNRAGDLFALVPKLLERRFGSLLAAHRQALSTESSVSDLARWMEPGEWIGMFCGDMRELLLAELEVRLQPVLGMMESIPEERPAEDAPNGRKRPRT